MKKALFVSVFLLAVKFAYATSTGTNTIAAIPWAQIGAKAGADYHGEGLAVMPTADGARLHCVFQRLDGEATPEGLWLTSIVTNGLNDRFRVVAAEVTRVNSTRSLKSETQDQVQSLLTSAATDHAALPRTGNISIDGQTVRFTRPGLVEEYSVSMDGVRQDFVVLEKPAGAGQLLVRLDVSCARVEQAVAGTQLVLEQSGRKIAYSRLRATDANGKELPALMEISPVAAVVTRLNLNPETKEQKNDTSQTLLTSAATGQELAVLVNDADAVYPLRIDPTFSDANWISMGGIIGANNSVYAAVVDGSGNLYIGGGFTAAGNTIANYIAKWDGNSWSPLGSGMNGSVGRLAVSGNDVYAGGGFTSAGGTAANYIAKWNGNTWSALGSGMNGSVTALAAAGSNLYASGSFTTAGGGAAKYIAKWDGSSWSALGLGMNNPGLSSGYNAPVFALAVSGSNLYAGGIFTTATNSGGGAVTVNRIAKWNGISWSALGLGMTGGNANFGAVSALAVSGSNVYAGGYFTAAGGIPANYLAKWDGSTWSALGSGLATGGLNWVNALAVSDNNLYVGGHFTMADDSAVTNIAKWDGSTWSALGTAKSRSEVIALAVSGSNIYAGGYGDTTIGPAGVDSNIMKWDGNNWSLLGLEIDGYVNAVAISGSDVYAGGLFTLAGGSVANCIAKWDGNSWSALGMGLGGTTYHSYVLALAVSGSNLYAGGYFTTATNSDGIAVPANYIAKWNGSSWSALGSGMDFIVAALVVSGNDMYAGGEFTSAGGIAAHYIAKWNGSSWSALSSGMGGISYPSVSALAASGSNVYAGGYFTSAGGIAAHYVAKWNGSSWSALGSGMNNSVSSLAMLGSELYAGGSFTTATNGGEVAVAANYIAKWNGSSWSALGSGMSDAVQALAVSGSNVYAGGYFKFVGVTNANYLAKWDGSNWSALGSGMDDYVHSLAVSGSVLYTGGEFTTAGGKVSGRVAGAIINAGNWLAIKPRVSGSNTNTFTYVGLPNVRYLLQFTTNLTTSPWLTLATNTAAGNGIGTVIDPMATNAQRFYRISTP
jgi:hypothetical protein